MLNVHFDFQTFLYDVNLRLLCFFCPTEFLHWKTRDKEQEIIEHLSKKSISVILNSLIDFLDIFSSLVDGFDCVGFPLLTNIKLTGL